MFIWHFFWIFYSLYILKIYWWWFWEEYFSKCANFFLIHYHIFIKCEYEYKYENIDDIFLNLIDDFSVYFIHEFSSFIYFDLFNFMIIFFFFLFSYYFIYIEFYLSVNILQLINFISQDFYIFIPSSFAIWKWSFMKDDLFQHFCNYLD